MSVRVNCKGQKLLSSVEFFDGREFSQRHLLGIGVLAAARRGGGAWAWAGVRSLVWSSFAGVLRFCGVEIFIGPQDPEKNDGKSDGGRYDKVYKASDASFFFRTVSCGGTYNCHFKLLLRVYL